MSSTQKKGYVLIAVVYLLGLFIGALDTGIVTPARTVIQADLGVDDQSGVWLITIYTLAYAAAIPIMGKLADKYGRKYIYLTSIFLFGLGSLLCGLAQDFSNFSMLLVARAIQAVGGGGIMPVATAEFGTAFPPEKRGMALGLVGGVYGIANVFGASAGSLILDIFGQTNWQFIFYVNLPICAFIIIAGLASLSNSKEKDVRPIDIWGTVTLVLMILSLLYGLRNLDLFDIASSIQSTDVYPFLIAFVILLPIFIFFEKRAADPVLNLSYFKNPSIVATLLLSIITGVIMMGMIFIPQFAENALYLPSGSGGYFVIILGLFAGVGSPMSGKLIDNMGVKVVLGFGLAVSVIGSLFLGFIAVPNPSILTVTISLVLIGLGLGFTMGTPLNYMMLEKTDPKESNSALATLSLVRSIGTAIAPAIMVAFIAQAGTTAQAAIEDSLPKTVTVPVSIEAQAVSGDLEALSGSGDMYDEMMEGIDLSMLTEPQVIDLDEMESEGDLELPDDIIALMQGSDVTTIADNTKTMVAAMFDLASPDAIASAQEGVQEGIDGTTEAMGQLGDALDAMPAASPAHAAMQSAYDQLEDLDDDMQALYDSIPQSFQMAKEDYLQIIDENAGQIQNLFHTELNEGFKEMFVLVAACALVGLVILMLYRDDLREERKRRKREQAARSK
ncbi:MAG: MFS transporter [Eggerthellaceae bacterium]|nr:MFS transporter [Eggerthellaceae bacterium]